MQTERSYPSPPWILEGEGLILITTKRNHVAIPLIPEPFSVQSIFPGRTSAGFYIASYNTPLNQNGNAPWHEWGDIWSFSRLHEQLGFYIREMAVDSESAKIGGSDKWGLNKSMGCIDFVPNRNRGKTALAIGDTHIELQWKEIGPSLRLHRPFSFLTHLNDTPHQYTVKMHARFSFCRIHVTQRRGNHFTSVEKGKYWGQRFKEASIEICEPTAIEALI